MSNEKCHDKNAVIDRMQVQYLCEDVQPSSTFERHLSENDIENIKKYSLQSGGDVILRNENFVTTIGNRPSKFTISSMTENEKTHCHFDSSSISSPILLANTPLCNSPIDVMETMPMDTYQSKELTTISSNIRRGRGRPRLPGKAKTSSERGKELRARRSRGVSELITQVGLLKSRVDELQTFRNILKQKSLQHSAMEDGSYVRRIKEYFTLFQRGCPKISVRQDAIQVHARQANFLKSFMSEDMIMKDASTGAIVRGAKSLFEQWIWYSLSHSFIGMEAKLIELISSHPTPIIRVESNLSLKFSRSTIETFYPHVLWDNVAVQELIGLNLDVVMILHFHFNEFGIVDKFDVELDFLSALVNALGSIEDALALTDLAVYQVRKQHMITPLDVSTITDEAAIPYEDLAAMQINSSE